VAGPSGPVDRGGSEAVGPLGRPLADLQGKLTLVVGLGGGSNAITAYALAHFLDPAGAIAYANTTRRWLTSALVFQGTEPGPDLALFP
jgi:hypothetical protein